MNFLSLFDLNYSYRAKTEAIFNQRKKHIFDFFMVEDQKFEQFNLSNNIWRETLLLHHFRDDPRVQKVVDFGKLPNKIIYREIEEV
jgi:hypothetical protein